MTEELIKLRNPIVLIHGLGAKATLGPIEYFYGVPSRLRKGGNRVFVPNVAAWNSIELRSEQLKHGIESHFPDRKVNLIGHSLGGLDARLVASDPEFGKRIASVTTIGTPNHGTIIGDILVGKVPAPVHYAIEKLLGLADMSNEGFQQVTRQYNNEILQDHLKDHPDVKYFSATSHIEDPVRKNSLPVFWWTHRIIKEKEGENDGMVSVQSAKYGHFICDYPGDHYAQIGHPFGRQRGLDHLRFYDEIFKTLYDAGL